MKRYFALFLTFILIFNFVSFSYADTIDNLINVNPDSSNISSNGTSNTTSDSSTSQVTMKDSTKSSGILSTIIEYVLSIFDVLNNWLIQIIYVLPTIDGCIFNTQDSFKISVFDTNPVGLSASLQSYVAAIYNAFRYLATAIYIVVLVYLAIRMMFSAIGRQKARYKELFKHWIVGLLLLFSFHWVMAFVLWISNTFVDILYNLTKGMISDIAMSGENKTVLANIKTELFPITSFVVTRISCIGNDILFILKPLLVLVAVVLFIGQEVSIMITYLKRLFTIMILILLFPLIALSYVFDKIGDRRAQTFEIWLKEFITNVMIQPLHALVLVFISMLFSANTSLFGRSVLGAVMVLVSMRLIPLGEELLKKVFQISSSMGPGSHGIAGSMAHAGMAISGAKNMVKDVANKGKATADIMKNDWRKHKLKKDTLARGGDKKEAEATAKAWDKELKAKYGTSTLSGAALKSAPGLAGAAFGVGTATTGSGSGRFLSDAAARASIYSSLGDGVVKGIENVGKLKNGDVARAKELGTYDMANKMSNPDKMNENDMKKLAVLLGIDFSTVKEAFANPKTAKNQAKIKEWQQSVNEMDINARFGDKSLKLDDIRKTSTTGRKNADILKGKDPITGEDLNLNDYDFIQTRNNTLIRSKKTGEEFIYNNNGDSSLDEGGRRVLDSTKLKGSAAKDKLIALEQTEFVTGKGLEDAKEARKHANSELRKLQDKHIDENSEEYKTAKVNFEVADVQYDIAFEKHREAKKNLTVAEKDVEKLLALDEKAVAAGAEPVFAETALDIVQNDLSKGEVTVASDNIKVTMNNNSTTYSVKTPNSVSEEVEINTNAMEEVKKAVRQEVITSNPELTRKISDLQTEYSNVLNIEDTTERTKQINKINQELNATELEFSNKCNEKIQEYTVNPTSCPTSSDVNLENVFTAIGVTNKITGANTNGMNTSFGLGTIPELEEQFSYGVCQDLADYLDEHNDTPTTITLTYASDTKFSIKAGNEENSTEISSTSTVVSNIFGGDYSPITLYSRNGAWYKKQ